MSEAPQSLLDAGAFDLGGDERRDAVLCVHGLTGTPYEVRPIGEALATAGLRAVGPMLPGHGGECEALARVGHEDWIDAVDLAYSKLANQHERVFVVGLSLGGLLSLWLAARVEVEALVVIGTPLHLRTRLASLVEEGLFQDVVLVEAAADGGLVSDGLVSDGGDELRDRLSSLAGEIADKRARKAEKIVRRLARLAFHEFARRDVRPAAAPLLASWEAGAARLLDDLRQNKKTAPIVIEDLLAGFAVFAEQLRPGVVTGDAVSGASATSRALTSPMGWPPSRRR